MQLTNLGYVYILTDKDDNVLYIGCTNNPTRRIKEHLRNRPDAQTDKLHHVYIAFCGSIEDALACEAWLIRCNNPPWNKTHPGLTPHVKSCDVIGYIRCLTFERREFATV